MPQEAAALSAVANRETHVKMAFDPEDFNWLVSSEALYAEFAGDEMPERLWTAQETGRLSNCNASTLDIEFHSGPVEAHCVMGKNGNDFVPLRPFVRSQVEIFG